MAGPGDIIKQAESLVKNATVGASTGVLQQNNPGVISVISPEVSDDTSRIGLETGYGEISQAITRAYYGINHRGTGSPIETNTDQYGLTFFTRPCLNLSYDNVAMDRMFAPLLTDEKLSMHRAIRAYLDPIGAHVNTKNSFHTPLVDDENPFFVLLSNLLISLNGWPDPYVETYTSTEGRYKEQWSMVDGPAKIYNAFTLNATFRNIVQDPVSNIFNIWTQYASRVHEGFMDPYPYMVLENTIDYQTRIYRLVLDKSRQIVQSIGACGAAFPTANNKGAKFNFNTDKPYNQELDQISVSFQCMGAMYDDPILVDEFNRTVQLFNITMIDGQRETYYVKLAIAELPLFNMRGYPRINPNTMELEWWVKKEEYAAMLGRKDPVTQASKTISQVQNGIQQVANIKKNVLKL